MIPVDYLFCRDLFHVQGDPLLRNCAGRTPETVRHKMRKSRVFSCLLILRVNNGIVSECDPDGFAFRAVMQVCNLLEDFHDVGEVAPGGRIAE